MRGRVDPVPFLLAVAAVAAGPLAQAGAWAWLNSAIGVSVFVVLAVFTWPRRREVVEQRLPTVPILAAQSVVYGFVAAMSAGYFVQRYVEARATYPSCARPSMPTDAASGTALLEYVASLECRRDAEVELAQSAMAGSVRIGLAVAALTFVALMGRVHRLRRALANEHGSPQSEESDSQQKAQAG